MTHATTWSDRAKDAALIPARFALGSTMLYHGTAKLRGEGPQQTGQMFEGLGLKPGKALAIATGLAETFAGAAAVLGIATRPAALAVLVTQAMAISKVHAPRGFFPMLNGGDAAILFCFIFLYFAVAGGGPWSLDRLLWPGGRR